MALSQWIYILRFWWSKFDDLNLAYIKVVSTYLFKNTHQISLLWMSGHFFVFMMYNRGDTLQEVLITVPFKSCWVWPLIQSNY